MAWDEIVLISAPYILVCLIIAWCLVQWVDVATQTKRSLAARYRQFRERRQPGNDQHYGDGV